MAQRPQHFGIYFDESARQLERKDDKGKRRPTGKFAYVYTAAVIQDSRKRSLERNLTRLRREMTAAVLKAAPHLRQDPRFSEGQLLEIHAVDLYQSGGVYREMNKIQPGFWRQQHQWLARCLEYGAGAGIRYFCHTTSTDQFEASWGGHGRLVNSIARDLPYEGVKAKLASLQNNPYFTSLPILLDAVDDYLISQQGYGVLFCHTYPDAKGFSTLDSFKLARERGHYTRLEVPQFKTCSEEQIIQCADAAGYVILQLLFATVFDQPLKPEFHQWMNSYVFNQWEKDPNNPPEDKKMSIGTLLMEFLMTNTGGPSEFQQAVKRTLPSVLRRSLAGDGSPWYLTEEGLVLGEPKVNRPQPEGRNLYDGIISQEGDAVQREG